MIIIPFDRKLNWSRPPVITLTLILLNVFCFFVWQAGDEQRHQQAKVFWYCR